MAQNLPPPAYQEYAANMLANFEFRKMSLTARGLLYTLRLENWVQTPIPSDALTMSQLLRFDFDEVVAALREIAPFLQEADGTLTFPELENYRQHLKEQREKKSEGGKVGAQRAKANKDKAAQISEVDPQGYPQVTTGSTQRFLVQKSKVQPNSAQLSSVSNSEHDKWINEYEQTAEDAR